jgi:hypothetical protein
VLPVVDLLRGSTAATTFRTAGRRLGTVHEGAVGPSGASAAPGALLPRTLARHLSAGASTLTATTRASEGDTTRLDAVLLQPLVTRLVLGGGGHGTALLRSVAGSTVHVRVSVPGHGRAAVWSYDGGGRLVSHHVTGTGASGVPVSIVPGGVTLVRR